jgi:hypothetical protein
MTTGDSHIGSNSQHRLSDQVSANTKYETLIKKRGADGGNPITEAIDHNPRDVPQPNAD